MRAGTAKAEKIMTELEMKAVIRAFRIKLEKFHNSYVARFDKPLLLVPGATEPQAVGELLRRIGGGK